MSASTFKIPYGDSVIQAELPERTRVIRQTNKPLPALSDSSRAVRNALKSPIAHEPLSKLVGPKSKVTIAFDDPSGFVPAQKQPDIREIAIKVLLEELVKLGVNPANVRLVCAVGLHRKWTTREIGAVIGEDLAYRFSPSQLYNHDAEDKENLVFLGETKRGHEVEVSRVVTDSDQLIYVGKPRSHFNGGWKSVTVGLSSYRSIRHHHRPFPKASGKSAMDPERSAFPKLLNEMGEVIDKELAKNGHRVLLIEGTTNNKLSPELVHVVAGHPPEAHVESLEILQKQLVVDVEGQSDVVVYGMGDGRDPYSKFSIINPILVRNLAVSYSFGLFQNIPLVKEGGIAIFVHPCKRQFDAIRHSSYVEVFEKLLPYNQNPFEIWELYAEDYAHRPEYIHNYRYGHSYHGVHPLILYGQGAYGLKHLGKAFLAGATDFEAARMVGFEPFATVEEAVAEAERLMGKDCSISYVEMVNNFICNVK
jgi:nickel-dependent lactate racemase